MCLCYAYCHANMSLYICSFNTSGFIFLHRKWKVRLKALHCGILFVHFAHSMQKMFMHIVCTTHRPIIMMVCYSEHGFAFGSVWFALTRPSIVAVLLSRITLWLEKGRENPVFRGMNPLKSVCSVKAAAVSCLCFSPSSCWWKHWLSLGQKPSEERESRWRSLCVLTVHAKCFKSVCIALWRPLFLFFPSGDPFLCPSQNHFSHSCLLLVLLLSFKLDSWAGQLT